MSLYQIGALCVLAAVLAWNFLPSLSLKLPTFHSAPSALKQIEQVIAIKNSSTNPKVQEACQLLLAALIQ